MIKIVSTMLVICFANIALAENIVVPCKDDLPRQGARSRELKEIVDADQADRTPDKVKKWSQLHGEISQRDLLRRKRVAEIFAEGCFAKAEDYAAAALVFQHGDHPDHFFQTYIWSKRGVELGDKSQNPMLANGIDRYLNNIGHKNLFASQAYKDEKDQNSCYCLIPYEKSFPDKLRIEIKNRSIQQSMEWLDELNEHRKDCPREVCRDKDLKATPKGSVPGLW